MAAQPAPTPPTAPEPTRALRHDGFNPDRERGFLLALADGQTVEAAARSVGLSASAAYARRRKPQHAAFALAWRASGMVNRDRLADSLMARALDGQTITWTNARGETITRHRHDNGLALRLLARLDRIADGPRQRAGEEPDRDGHEAARLVAGDYDRFLDLLGEDGAGAAAGLFLELAAARDATRDSSSLPQLHQLRALAAAEAEALAPADPEDAEEPDPVWFDTMENCWMTDFPPPPGFDGRELARYGEDHYARELTSRELAVARERADAAQRRLLDRDAPERDAWFGFAPEEDPAPSRPEDAGRPPVADVDPFPDFPEPGATLLRHLARDAQASHLAIATADVGPGTSTSGHGASPAFTPSPPAPPGPGIRLL